MSAVLVRYQELIRTLSGGPVRLSLRKLEDIPPNSGDFRSALKKIQRSGERRFILDCDWRAVYNVLHQARNNCVDSTRNKTFIVLLFVIAYAYRSFIGLLTLSV